jgi:hypothetical protein
MATTTFSERDAALDAIVASIATQQSRLAEIKATANAIIGALSELPTTYAEHITDIGTEASENPTDAALVNHNGKLTLLVDEFTALETLVQGILDEIG